MTRSRTLRLERYSRSHRQLAYVASVGDLSFATSFWWDSVDLLVLEDRFGSRFMERLYLHIIAFDLNKLVSFAPEAPLAPGTTYRLQVPAGGVVDLNGNAVSAPFISRFTTAGTAPP